MNWLWPWFLFLLGGIPLLVGAYVWMLRRRRKFAVRYSSLSLVREALPRRSSFRRHFPFALFLLALVSLILALARPVSAAQVPSGKSTIILAIDVSRSMRQRDVRPSRLAAAQQAALSFVKSQPANTQIGIVAFSTYADLIQPPTTDQNALRSAIESLTLGHRTAIGLAIIESINAIAQSTHLVMPVTTTNETTPEQTPAPNGSYIPAVIVLLTDGVTTTGPQPLDVAPEAVKRGVRVYTIGFGTKQGDSSFGFGQSDPFGGNGGNSGGNGVFGGGNFGSFGGFGGFQRGIDEQTLRDVAQMTGGKYYTAASADELLSVFQRLPINLTMKKETTELSVVFAALGALLAAAAIGLALLWNPIS